MKRKDFFKILGVAGAGSMLPLGNHILKAKDASKAHRFISENNNCVLIPSETAGPFPLDLTDNEEFFRQDVREDREGVPLHLKMKIIGLDNCQPMPNVRVNIWHCDKDGNYSGYQSETGQTYLRGYQIADANGEVEFITVFPGWYPGRICHIHFQVYVSSMYSAISQLAFPEKSQNEVYGAYSDLYTRGDDPQTFNSDNIFGNDYQLQVATLAFNEAEEVYESYIEVTVQGEGVVGVGHIERQTAKQFILGQNFPNPFKGKTTIPFELKKPAEVRLEILDFSGKKVKTLNQGRLGLGQHIIALDLKTLGLTQNNYVYQMHVENADGKFVAYKVMTGK